MFDVTGEVFCEKAARKIRKIHRKTTGMKPIFVKLQTRFSTLLKKDSISGVFLRVLRTVSEQIF